MFMCQWELSIENGELMMEERVEETEDSWIGGVRSLQVFLYSNDLTVENYKITIKEPTII